MLRKEQNELLTQTGPGTPMGQLFRSYWMPVLLAAELPEDDCPPVRVKILSERLLAFRDSAIRDLEKPVHRRQASWIWGAMGIKAWNAYRLGRPIKQLGFRAGGASPEEFPEAV